jgi:hypothetical protein
MITVLADHNIEGQAQVLLGALAAAGWLDLIPIRLMRFTDVGLAFDSADRDVWHFAQQHQMLLLTDNRNMTGDGSLEQTIREQNSATSHPVITISRTDRLLEKPYRERCAIRLLEIALDLDRYLGSGRLYLP